MGSYQKGQAKEIPIGSFEPDSSPDKPGILLDMQGGFPTMKGHQAFNGVSPAVAAALIETPLGATVASYSTGATQLWVGGTNDLYRMSGTLNDPASTWIVADSLGGGNEFNAVKWRFAQFNDDLIAVGGAGVAPQVASGSTATFAPLGGAPPAGATIVIAVNSQIMMFLGNKWFASAIGGDNSWVTPANNQGGTGTQIQAGFAPITDLPGNIIAAQPIFRNVIAFKQQGIWLGSYVGGDSIWSFQLIDDLNGTWSQEATMTIPGGVAFLGLDDFYICTGYTPQRIPNQLKEWFFDTADPTQLSAVTARYDVYHAVGYWHFVSKTPPFAGVPDRYVSYNFRGQRWAAGYLSTPCVPIPNYIFGQPSSINGLYFDANHILQSFQGPPGAMRLLTGYLGMPGKKSQLFRVRPKYGNYPQTESIQGFHVNHLGGMDTAGPIAVKGNDDWFNLRQTDRYHRIQFSVSGTTASILPPNIQAGVEVVGFAFEAREAGGR